MFFQCQVLSMPILSKNRYYRLMVFKDELPATGTGKGWRQLPKDQEEWEKAGVDIVFQSGNRTLALATATCTPF